MTRAKEAHVFRVYKCGIIIGILSATALLAGCVPPPYRAEPWPLEKAVRLMTDDLLHQITAKRGVLGGVAEGEIIMDAIIDSETGEVTKTSHRIQEVIASQARAFAKFKVSDMTRQNVKTAQYVLSGILHLEETGGTVNKIIRLSASVVDMAAGQIAAHSEAFIADANLAFEPTQMYRDSPMYLKDRRVQSLIDTAQASVGSMADKEYIGTLFTSALLGEAENAYNGGDYAQAAELFSKVAERDDGKVMKTYSGLYECYRKLGHKAVAEEAFSSLVGLGIQNKNLSMKFLFETDRTDFVRDAEMRSEYAIWMRQLAKQILASDKCMQIIGHASKSGSRERNDKLSLERAKEIQRQLGQPKDKRSRANKTPDAPKKIDAIGRGFAECKKCTGNDAVDTYDRRVEFKVLDCGGL